jgi:hypothetical protein
MAKWTSPATIALDVAHSGRHLHNRNQRNECPIVWQTPEFLHSLALCSARGTDTDTTIPSSCWPGAANSVGSTPMAPRAIRHALPLRHDDTMTP